LLIVSDDLKHFRESRGLNLISSQFPQILHSPNIAKFKMGSFI